MRKVDKLGRIVIPQELRQKYGLCEGAEIEFLDVGEGITVRPSERFCVVCRQRISGNESIPLCEDCIERIIKEYSGKAKSAT